LMEVFIKTAKRYKISYTCSNHFLGYLAVEASFIFDFGVVKQRVPEKIGLCMGFSILLFRWVAVLLAQQHILICLVHF
jgi:hypothetical protein